ncbi:hypothetical protein LAWI1_G000740 [Lachnellula willkommii]|uniref:Uncharacterized protein n=1 Tax=Lachnellula willkommii TaxID=215461 RepID=A0A559MLJ4_9HELO|nr:hypothetical protein LAWI1_G000740 [Lachnellula willkommii]
MATAAKNASYLPPEIWIRTLKNFDQENDLPELWMNYRHICKPFQSAIDSIFIEKHLPKTWIRWSLGEMYSNEIGKVILDTEFKFHALSEDKTTAIFQGDIGEDFRDEVRSRLKGRIQETTNAHAYTITEPSHTVQVHRDVNDSPLPDLTFDAENIHLSLNWRELYTRFYGEELLYHKGLQNWSTDNTKLKEELAAKAGSGQTGMMEVLMKAMEAFAGGSDESRRVARRARIRRQFREIGDDWSFEASGDAGEEKRSLEGLAQTRQLVSLTEDSDYDRDEEEEEGSEEGSEEGDEWEDASDDDDMEEEDEEEEEEDDA